MREHRFFARAKAVFVLAIFAQVYFQTLVYGKQPNFQGVGDLPGGDFYSYPQDVSGDGSTVVGYSIVASSQAHAFRWSDGQMIDLGDLQSGTTSSRAHAVSFDGSVIVGNSDRSGGYDGFRWEGGVMTRLEVPAGCWQTGANGVSADGRVIVGSSRRSGYWDEPMRWEDGSWEWIGDLQSGAVSLATDVSADGFVAVGRILGNTAFSWENGAMQKLSELPGGDFYSAADAISADKTTIVGVSHSGLGYEAVMWRDGAIGTLGDLPGGIVESAAHDVSADGSVVIGSGYSSWGREAFIWDGTHGMRGLKSVLISDYGLNLTGWRLVEGFGVSDDGRTFVGVGVNPNGLMEGWIATIPEPASAAIMILGAVVITLRRRR